MPLIAIVGPTASGKTSLAVTLAKKYSGEIICADSRTVYRHMDIGTAKPTFEEQSHVQHWGIDLVSPNEKFTVVEFKDYADKKIREIRERGHVPFLVGGSGLYVDAVLFDYTFGPLPDPDERQVLEAMSVEDLQQLCKEKMIELPQNFMNKRHLVRAIEQKGINNQRRGIPLENSHIFGIKTDVEHLRERARARAGAMLEGGLLREAASLADQYSWELESMTGNVYPLCRMRLQNEISQEELLERIIVQDCRLAKKQMTWFRRNRYIRWSYLDDAEECISLLLDSEQ